MKLPGSNNSAIDNLLLALEVGICVVTYLRAAGNNPYCMYIPQLICMTYIDTSRSCHLGTYLGTACLASREYPDDGELITF